MRPGGQVFWNITASATTNPSASSLRSTRATCPALKVKVPISTHPPPVVRWFIRTTDVPVAEVTWKGAFVAWLPGNLRRIFSLLVSAAVFVVVDPDGGWKKEWGELYRWSDEADAL